MTSLTKYLLVCGLAFILALAWSKPFEASANQQVDDGLKRALVTYATARAMHAGVSALQGTQVNASPAGIGATFSPGQLLAPVAELLKQFSDLMLLVAVAFGLQKLLLTLGGAQLLTLTLTLTAVAWAIGRLRQSSPPVWLTKVLIMLVLLRFALPLAALGSEQVYQSFIHNTYQQSQAAIDTEFKTSLIADNTKLSYWDRLKQIPQEKYTDMKSKVEQATEHIVTLMAIFILQTIVTPVLLLFGFFWLTRQLLWPTP